MHAYIYQSALYCPGCAVKIRTQLRAEDTAVCDDADDYPQGPYADGGGEADSPQHCGMCGRFLENPLTADGVKYVAGAIAGALNVLATRGRTQETAKTSVRTWADFYKLTVSDLLEAMGAGVRS